MLAPAALGIRWLEGLTTLQCGKGDAGLADLLWSLLLESEGGRRPNTAKPYENLNPLSLSLSLSLSLTHTHLERGAVGKHPLCALSLPGFEACMLHFDFRSRKSSSAAMVGLGPRSDWHMADGFGSILRTL